MLNRRFGKQKQAGEGSDPSWSSGIKKLMGRVHQLRGETAYLEHPGDFRPNQPANYTPAHLQEVRASMFSSQSYAVEHDPRQILNQFPASPFGEN